MILKSHFTVAEIKQMAALGAVMDARATLYPDRFESSVHHFMIPRKQFYNFYNVKGIATAELTIKWAEGAVNEKLTKADRLLKIMASTSGARQEEARQAFLKEMAIALHIIMDATSPAHVDEIWQTGCIHGN